ncbi:MAG TPA: hypothetical protein VMY35_13555 [Phycisphaerae bacterium]|nr:hypothetical protein [Phycisphaerae bacterium]
MAKTSTRLVSSGTRAQGAAGLTPVDRYAEKKQGSNFTDDTGREHWTRQFRIPASKLKELAPYLKKSTDNILPGSDRLDVYAPCIHSCQMADSDDDAVVAVCDYQRPTREMILRPGRAYYETGTYVTTVKEEVALFCDGRETMIQMGIAPASIASAIVKLEIKEAITIKHRGIVTVYEADSADDEWPLHEREQELRGKGGTLVVDADGHSFGSLKLSEVQIGRRAGDLSILDSTWKFSQNLEGFRIAPYIVYSYFCVDLQGNTVTYDPTTRVVTDSEGKIMQRGTYMLVPLQKYDPDVITGMASFSVFTEYFAWMT